MQKKNNAQPTMKRKASQSILEGAKKKPVVKQAKQMAAPVQASDSGSSSDDTLIIVDDVPTQTQPSSSQQDTATQRMYSLKTSRVVAEKRLAALKARSPPEAPVLEIFDKDDLSDDMLMSPQPFIAFRLGHSDVFALLAGTSINCPSMYLKEFVRSRDSSDMFQWLPKEGKQHLRLDAQQASNLLHMRDVIRAVMHDGGPRFGTEVIGIGKRVRVTLLEESNLVDIRQFWQPEDTSEENGTKKGVRLNTVEFDDLAHVLDTFYNLWEEMSESTPCPIAHDDDEGKAKCQYCTPAQKKKWSD